MNDAGLEFTTRKGHRLGQLIFDPKGRTLLAITGDLPDRFATDDPTPYRPLISAGVTTISARSSRRPTVSVIIPARNPPADTFYNLVDNLSGTPWVNEIIVVDDGSDQPIAVDGAIVVRNQLPVGPAGARNLGAQRSKAEVLIFVDADIVRIEDNFFELVSILGNHQIAALAPRVTEEGHPSPLDLGPHPAEVDGKHLNHLPSAVLAVDRSIFQKVAGFAEDLRLGEDVDLVARICSFGQWAIYATDCIAVHYPQSLVRRMAKAASYGYSVGQLRKQTSLRLVPPLKDAPKLVLTFFAPLSMATISAVSGAAHLNHRLTRGQRAKAGVLLLDQQLGANSSTILRQFGFPIALLAVISPKLRRALAGALAIELIHQGVTKTIYDIAYSIGLWLSLALEP